MLQLKANKETQVNMWTEYTCTQSNIILFVHNMQNLMLYPYRGVNISLVSQCVEIVVLSVTELECVL